MADREEASRRGRGRFYSGLLTVIVSAVVALAASALYVTAGGELFGWTGSAFGIRSTEPVWGSVLQRAREAAWRGEHERALVLYDSVLVAHTRSAADDSTDERTIALERAKVLAWGERYGEAADALAEVADPSDLDSSLERARYLWWSGRPAAADSLLSDVLARHPELGEARELQELVRPSVEPAVDIAGRWLDERPGDPFAHLWMARALVREERAMEALDHYRRSFATSGSVEPEVILEAAGVALTADSLRYAAEILARYLDAVEHEDRPTRLRLARAYAWSGRYDEAESQYRQVLALREDGEVRLELARTLLAAGRDVSAIAELRRLEAERPSREVRRELAVALERAGRDAEAASVLLRMVEDGGETRDLVSLARVLAAMKRYGEAAAVLGRVEARAPGDADIPFTRGRYLWWAGEPVQADSVLTALLDLHPEHDDARVLREAVRTSIDPGVDLARSWLRGDGSAVNQLRLARALVRDERPAEALEHYGAALDPNDRELVHEAVDAAEAADSLQAATRLIETALALLDAPDAPLLERLARLYGWRGQPDASARTYRAYLAQRPDDTDARLALGRQLAWAGEPRWDEAETELLRVVEEDRENVEALRLLGDLHRWTGDARGAIAYYDRALAIDAAAPGAAEGLALAREAQQSEGALQDATRVAWIVEADAFFDSDDFEWVGTTVTRRHPFGPGTLSLAVSQGYSGGVDGQGGSLRSLGLGARLSARIPVGRYAALLEAGASSFPGTQTIPTWGAGFEYRDAATRAVLRYDRTPAVREAGRIVALEEEAVLDRVRMSGTRSWRSWAAAGEVQLQRFGSEAGSGTRYALMARSDRALGSSGLSVGAMVRTIAATDPAPAAGWGGLYWAPRMYLAPAVTFGLSRPIGSDWWLGLRAAPGYAWIDERETGLARFRDGTTPILEAGAGLGYRNGPWAVDFSGDFGGALSSDYRSGSFSIQISRSGGIQ